MKWIRRSSDFINKWKKDRRVRLGITLAAVIISALIQTYALQVFVRPAGIISGGFTGIFLASSTGCPMSAVMFTAF